MISKVPNFEVYFKNKKPHSLTMNGVLDASEHFASLRQIRGDNSNSANFYLTTFLYKNTILDVKKKIENLYKKQNVRMIQNYFL